MTTTEAVVVAEAITEVETTLTSIVEAVEDTKTIVAATIIIAEATITNVDMKEIAVGMKTIAEISIKKMITTSAETTEVATKIKITKTEEAIKATISMKKGEEAAEEHKIRIGAAILKLSERSPTRNSSTSIKITKSVEVAKINKEVD